MDDNIFIELQEVIRKNKKNFNKNSYTSSLLHGDADELLKKIVEEAAETALAGRSGDIDKFKEEMADLFFHCMVIMTKYDIPIDDIIKILKKRRGISGIDEKNSRDKKDDNDD